MVVMTKGERLVECEEEEVNKMQDNFINCTQHFKQEYNVQAASPGADPLAATCHLVDNLVATCGSLWSLCSPGWRVQEMKDHYLEVLLGKNSATVDIEQCSVVRDYRRRHHPKLEIECAPALVASSRAKFQICSHNTTTAAYSEVREQEDASVVLSSCCRALQRMERRCYRHLTDCLSSEDVQEVKKVHMVEIMDYLMAMAEGKVARWQLERCRESNNDMVDVEGEELDEELSSSEYNYDDYRYDYSEEEYSEEDYNHEEEENEQEDLLLVEADNAVPAVYKSWTTAPLGESEAVGKGKMVEEENEKKRGDLEDKEGGWMEKNYVETGSPSMAKDNQDKDPVMSGQKQGSEEVFLKKSSGGFHRQESKSENEKSMKANSWKRKTKEKRKSEDVRSSVDKDKEKYIEEVKEKDKDHLSSASLDKGDFWEEDGGGFLDLGGKSENWGEQLFVRSSQSRFAPFSVLIFFASLTYNIQLLNT